ncbi:MAG: type II toxin-antitoxin system VapC family toxin [Spirochaetales bacterium]|nr:type II toxin-antitoxin system VapC family toxin [Spirochaetales bacterium]
MILLDTNYLIRSLIPETIEAIRIIEWIQNGEILCTSGVAWYEFLCGPVDDEGIIVVHSLLEERVIPFTSDHSAEAAHLFNKSGRKRHLRVDAMIASAAIISNASLATENIIDFKHFVDFGLQLI